MNGSVRTGRTIPRELWLILAFVWIVLLGNLLASMGFGAETASTPEVQLAGMSYPGVSAQLVYPRRLDSWEGEATSSAMTLYVTPRRPDIQGVTLVVAPEDRSVVVLDASGQILSTPLEIVFDYPTQAVIPLQLASVSSIDGASLLSSHRVELSVSMLEDDVLTPVDDLGAKVVLSSGMYSGLQRLSEWLCRIATPIVAVMTFFALLVACWQKQQGSRALVDRELGLRIAAVRELIESGHLVDARRAARALRREAPDCERLDHLDALLQASPVTSSPEDTLTVDDPDALSKGIAAYKARDWSQACAYLDKAGQADAYSPHLSFLYRTACLYLALDGRDRGRRVSALNELGKIGDLVDLVPLVDALDDGNPQVARAAEDALVAVGALAFDAVAEGLKSPLPAVAERSRSVLARLGQDVLEQLLSLLHTKDTKQVATASDLLIGLGAREQLAEALLWADPDVLEGIAKALASDEIVACQPLLDVLAKASADRQQYVLSAIGELKCHARVDRHIEDRQRSTRDSAIRRLYGQALHWPACEYAKGLERGSQAPRQVAKAR